MTDIAIVLGTRPEIIKLSPVIRECENRGLSYTVVHTGQHYSEELDSVFFDRLGLPTPDYNLSVGSGSHGAQTGEMLAEIESVLVDEDPAVVLVQGDTNSVLAGAIATSKLDAELGHVEAGLRSFDREMPEEINRILSDHVADYLFAPTDEAKAILLDEGRPEERVYVTGNTIVDAVVANREMAAEKSDVLDEFGLEPEEFILVTAHRAENVDDPDRLRSLLDGIDRAARHLNVRAIYPVHPRTQERIREFDVTVPSTIDLVEPLDFLDFLHLEDTATLAITDSGGVQEETCILGTPCVTVRDSTERPETVTVGANVVVGTDPEDIRMAADKMVQRVGEWENPFGDGNTAGRILDVLQSE